MIPRAGSGDAPLATKAPRRDLFIKKLHKRTPHAALLPLDPPMASSSNTPARLRSFHAALARSIASAAAFVSAAENPPVDANGPGCEDADNLVDLSLEPASSFAGARRSPTQRAGDGRRHPEDTRQDAAGHPHRSGERATRDSLAPRRLVGVSPDSTSRNFRL